MSQKYDESFQVELKLYQVEIKYHFHLQHQQENYEEIEVLLNHLIPKKALHEYGVKEEELEEFTEVVMRKQGRLMANNYVKLDWDTIYGIYKTLF